jgi:two-component system response regulator PilR (NtrC family)
VNVIELRVPPLRERPEDIPELAEHILGRLAAQAKVGIPALSAGAMAALGRHPFPGNVRELENMLERAMTLCSGDTIEEDDLGMGTAEAIGVTPSRGADGPLDSLLDQVEKDSLIMALEQTGGNKTAAAKLLGISFGAFRYRLQKLGLD